MHTLVQFKCGLWEIFDGKISTALSTDIRALYSDISVIPILNNRGA